MIRSHTTLVRLLLLLTLALAVASALGGFSWGEGDMFFGEL
jgi:hypothetical protein